MALGITKIPINVKNAGGFRFKFIKFVGDTDIPAAGTGYTLTAALLGFPNGITAGIVGADTTGVYNTAFNPATGAFRWFNASTAVEAAAGENGVDTLVVYGFFVGY